MSGSISEFERERETLPPLEAHDTLPPSLPALDEAAAHVFAELVGGILDARLKPLTDAINAILKVAQEVPELREKVTKLRSDVDELLKVAAE